ncbi:MAG: pilus assembly protein PilM [Chloroflexota bacterium]
MARRVVALYVSDTSVRMLVANGKRAEKWADQPLEPGMVRDGVVVDRVGLAARVKEMLKTQGAGARRVIAGLTGLHSLSRVVTLPRLHKSLLGEAVKREAELALPVPLEQLYLSWQVVGSSREETEVFLTALPRNTVDALMETLRLAGAKPHVMDLAPLALTRVAKSPTAVVADVRQTEVDIVVKVAGIPRFVRSLSYPTEAVSIQEKLLIVKEELERSMNYHDAGHSAKPLGADLPIFVSGELMQETTAYQFLAAELNRTVLPLPCPLSHADSFIPGQQMVNIGLALKELQLRKSPGSVVNLNALPAVYRPTPPSATRILVVPSVLMAVALLISLGLLVKNTVARTDLMQTQLDATIQLLEVRQTQQELRDKESAEVKKGIAELQASYEALSAKVSALNSVLDDFSRQQQGVNGDMGMTTTTLADAAGLNRVSHANDGMTIQGFAPGETEVLAYASALRDSGRFSQVVISSMQRSGDGVGFTLTLRTERQS